MGRRSEQKLERQEALVVRLAAELRFELLLLRRMRADPSGDKTVVGSEPTLAEVHAAAVLREAGSDLTP